MPIEKDKVLEGLQWRVDELDKVTDTQNLDIWFDVTLNFISSVYGKKTPIWNNLYSKKVFFTNLGSMKKSAKDILEGLMKEIGIIGVPQPQTIPANTQSQVVNVSQTVDVNIVIKQAIQQLPPELLEKVKSIIESNKGQPRESVFDKIYRAVEALGIGVGSSCIATMLMGYYWPNVGY